MHRPLIGIVQKYEFLAVKIRCAAVNYDLSLTASRDVQQQPTQCMSIEIAFSRDTTLHNQRRL